MHSLYDHLQYWTRRMPNETYLIEVETEHQLTYQQCLQAVHCMQHHLGDEPKIVFLQLPNGLPNAVVWLSALMGGHVLVPLAQDASKADKQRAMRMFQPDIVFVESEDEGKEYQASGARIVMPQEYEAWILQPEATFNTRLSRACEGRVCIMTSGTTGEPKGVVLEERQIVWSAEQVRAVHQLEVGDRGLTPLPFFHVNAPVVSLCASLLAGASVAIARRFSRRRFWSWITQYQVTWASLVPAIIAILLEEVEGETVIQVPPSLRFVRTGSAPLPAMDLKRFEGRFGVPVIETYGLSEAASMIVANPLPPEPHKPGSAGRPVGVSLCVCQPRGEDEVLRKVAQGEVGEVCVRGPNVINAYYGDVGEEAFQQGWFRTGDLGYLDKDGYLFLVGRLREVINRGGENIAPREIEEVLQEYPMVRELVAIGRPDPVYGEVVVAYLTVQSEWNKQVEQGLKEFSRQHLRLLKVPVDFIVLDALPKNRMGKVDRQQLKAREKEMACDTCNVAD
ncbi:AMP-binding protein [Ktedonospora formicarum]|uniref:AMP-dependent ligase n=1 Tax=Ktedonospora formicarum TaxID=2778364 RepID=A0A8J3MSH2_9CHLR|nr:AMP-binding protein [Ktedonospora formicarum]GHO46120.1 AMP-dependent ligase [Ktedonospora formicarum]